MAGTATVAVTTEEAARCHDCGCLEGELHQRGCDMERCPWCGGQLITCDCRYKLLGYRIFRIPNEHPTSGLPKSVYEHGLPADQAEEFERMLARKGRIPYIRWPVLCAYCGQLWPEFFGVPDADWNHSIEPAMRDKVVCLACYKRIKRLVDGAQAQQTVDAHDEVL